LGKAFFLFYTVVPVWHNPFPPPHKITSCSFPFFFVWPDHRLLPVLAARFFARRRAQEIPLSRRRIPPFPASLPAFRTDSSFALVPERPLSFRRLHFLFFPHPHSPLLSCRGGPSLSPLFTARPLPSGVICLAHFFSLKTLSARLPSPFPVPLPFFSGSENFFCTNQPRAFLSALSGKAPGTFLFLDEPLLSLIPDNSGRREPVFFFFPLYPDGSPFP